MQPAFSVRLRIDTPFSAGSIYCCREARGVREPRNEHSSSMLSTSPVVINVVGRHILSGTIRVGGTQN